MQDMQLGKKYYNIMSDEISSILLDRPRNHGLRGGARGLQLGSEQRAPLARMDSHRHRMYTKPWLRIGDR